MRFGEDVEHAEVAPHDGDDGEGAGARVTVVEVGCRVAEYRCGLVAVGAGQGVESVDDVVSVGQKILVKITKIDDRGKLSLEPVLDDAPAA